jgi:serine/threonine protein kinase
MPSSQTCPDEAELLRLAMEDPLPDEMAEHLAGCSDCRERIAQKKADVASLRAISLESHLMPSASMSASTTSKTIAYPSATNGEVDLKGFMADHDDGAEPPLSAAIGKYMVVGRFPRSGQAEVFRVVHPGLAKDLVLKLARKPLEPGARHEIIEEGKILADLKHSNLVPVYDLDFHDERPYLVMEYIRGRHLEQLTEAGKLKPRQATLLLAKVAAAVEYVHRHGITHRDIKPTNILVDEAGEPWLIDFGMARLKHAWSEDMGRPGGTFAFMPPEQARAESSEQLQQVGPRSDVFALGAVLYFLLTGKPPFSGETRTECWYRAWRCHFDKLALDAPTIPRELKRICLKAMSVTPAERYASAEELRKALKRCVLGPVVRNSAGAMAFILLLGSLVYAVWHLMPAPDSRPSVPAPVSTPTIKQPMKGRIDLLVVKSKDGRRRRLRLADRGALPVRAGDEIRIEARIDRPVYLYLFWLGSEGKVAPLYPWKDHDWLTRPTDERRVTGAELPEVADDVWTMPTSAPGLETLVLLAREDSPLPREDESKLAEGLSISPVALPVEMKGAVWLEDGQEVIFNPGHGGRELGGEPLSRGIPSPTPRKSDDPVLRIRAILSDRIQPLCSYSQAVLFPSEGSE